MTPDLKRILVNLIKESLPNDPIICSIGYGYKDVNSMHESDISFEILNEIK